MIGAMKQNSGRKNYQSDIMQTEKHKKSVVNERDIMGHHLLKVKLQRLHLCKDGTFTQRPHLCSKDPIFAKTAHLRKDPIFAKMAHLHKDAIYAKCGGEL
jgi:hypothetical protein